MAHLCRTGLLYLVLIAALCNVHHVKSQGLDFLGGIINSVNGVASGLLKNATGLLGGVTKPISIFAGLLNLPGPLSEPVKKLLEGILNTTSEGLPLGKSQVEDLLKILNVTSIKDLNPADLSKIEQMLNITQILEVEVDIEKTFNTK